MTVVAELKRDPLVRDIVARMDPPVREIALAEGDDRSTAAMLMTLYAYRAAFENHAPPSGSGLDLLEAVRELLRNDLVPYQPSNTKEDYLG